MRSCDDWLWPCLPRYRLAKRSSRQPWSTRRTCAWWAIPTPAGTAVATSSAPPRWRCGTSSSNRRGARALERGGGGRRVAFTEGLAIIEPPAPEILAVEEAIQQLETEKPHLAEIARLRYFVGLSFDETAAVLGISASTLTREWRFARAWLVRRLRDGELPGGSGPAHA